MRVLVTGSNGLIGSEAVSYFDGIGADVVGVDNNMRAVFFGPDGDTRWNQRRLETRPGGSSTSSSTSAIAPPSSSCSKRKFDLIVHCAAQPSHDLAASMPFEDFDVNAVGTMNLLEALRRHQPETVFAFTSTNKVYGDAPNEVPLKELETRWEYARPEDWNGRLGDLPHRSLPALALRRIEGRRRRHGAGVRASTSASRSASSGAAA